MNGLNGFDIFIVVVVAFCLLRGVFRGFIKEVTSIIGVIAGFYGSYTYYKLLALLVNKWIGKLGVGVITFWESYGNIISFFLLFVLIVSITAMIAQLIRTFLKIVFLRWVDKLFGMIFGSLKGILLTSVVFTVLASFLPGQPEFLTKSILAPYVVHVSEMTTVFISKEVKGDLKNKIERIKEIWKQQNLAIEKKSTEQKKSTSQESMMEKIQQTITEKITEKMTIPEK